ncbi:MAG: 4Fe-4S dicluster domain-containing protein [Lentisphaerae bacterium]|nr:4Fe-4S dicluster domain-containing protein [Lentisphaerota bacterium]
MPTKQNASRQALQFLYLLMDKYILSTNRFRYGVDFMKKRFIEVDPDKCTACTMCVRDCMTGALQMSEEKHTPEMVKDGSKICFDCQHCLAVCPAGALSFSGIKAADVPATESLPAGGEMLALIRQRRSIRQFKQEPLDRETMELLKECLHWVPTGCNDHRLRFFIAGPQEIAEFRRIIDRRLRFMIKSGIMTLLVPRYRRYFDTILNGADVIFREAPHIIIVMSPRKSPCCTTDQVIALTQFDMMAQSLGVGTCWCGFAERAFRMIGKLRRMIGCPAGYYIGGAMLFGRPAVKYYRATEPEKYIIEEKIKP